MALPSAAMPAYYSPASASRNHSRRSSGRRSFAAIPSVAGVESPRTLCPRDGDAFSYRPQHLKEWFISQNLWNNLPATVQSSVAALQHSGAAVLTGFERLEKHSEASLAARVADVEAEAAAATKADAAAAIEAEAALATVQSNVAGPQQSGAAAPTGVELLEKYSEAFPNDELATMVAEATEMWKTIPAKIQSTMARLQALQHEFVDGMEVLGSTNLLKARAMSDASSRRDSVYSPSFSASSSRSNSPPPSMSDSPPPAMSDPRTTSAPPSVSESQTTCPVSPMCLNPETSAEEVNPFAHKRHHERRVTFPLEPHKAYYVTELTTLRTEALPRLRHASRKVDTEWYECKRLGAVQSDDIAEFEQWYHGKKATIRELDDKCKALCAASDISPTGMGWTCPIKKGPM